MAMKKFRDRPRRKEQAQKEIVASLNDFGFEVTGRAKKKDSDPDAYLEE